MKKHIFGRMAIITFSGLLVLMFSNFAVTEDNPLTRRGKLTHRKTIQKLSDTALIKQKMNLLGFQVGDITKKEEVYIITIVGFTAKTQAITRKGGFKKFSLTAKVDKGQVVLEKAGLQKAGFVIKEIALPKGIITSLFSTIDPKIAVALFSKIDLVIVNCRVSQEGQSVIANAKLKNSGTEGASFQTGETMAELNASGNTFKITAPGGGRYIGPGSEVDLARTFSAAPGTLRTTWTADPDKLIMERNENNNTGNCQLVVEEASVSSGALPDMIVSQIVIEPASGTTSTIFVFKVTVKNQGNAVAPGSVYLLVGARLDGSPFEFTPEWGGYRDLSSGQSRTYTLRCDNTFIPGTHILSCTVDRRNGLTESNEDNNTRTAQFVVR